MIKLLFVLFFLIYCGFLANISFCYVRYRSLWPEDENAGLMDQIIDFIRVSPETDYMSEECRAAFVMLKKAAWASVAMTATGAVLILVLKLTGFVMPD